MNVRLPGNKSLTRVVFHTMFFDRLPDILQGILIPGRQSWGGGFAKEKLPFKYFLLHQAIIYDSLFT
jgi:hypothetical protein